MGERGRRGKRVNWKHLSVKDWASLCLGYRKGSPLWFLARKFNLTVAQVGQLIKHYRMRRRNQIEFDLK